RAQRTLPLFETLRQDVRYALRLWRRAPGFTAVVVAVVALGIGANSAIFNVVDALLLRTLPVHGPGRLVFFTIDSTGNSDDSFSLADFVEFRERNHLLAGLCASGGLRPARM